MTEAAAATTTTATTESVSSMMIDPSRLPSIKDINKNRKSNAKKPAPGGVGKRSNATQEAKKASSQAIRRNVVNLIQSDMDKEKMKKRSERFGLNANAGNSNSNSNSSDDGAKMAERAKRFGIVTDADRMKARAERFSIVTDADRMKARAERFGMK